MVSDINTNALIDLILHTRFTGVERGKDENVTIVVPLHPPAEEWESQSGHWDVPCCFSWAVCTSGQPHISSVALEVTVRGSRCVSPQFPLQHELAPRTSQESSGVEDGSEHQ